MSNIRIDLVEKQVTVMQQELTGLQKELRGTQQELSDILREMQVTIQGLAKMVAIGNATSGRRLDTVEEKLGLTPLEPVASGPAAPVVITTPNSGKEL